MRLKPAMHAFEKTDEADRRGADRGILVWAQRSLTVGGLDPHVLELDERGALDDHFDRLLSVFAADVAFALGQLARRAIALIADGGFERKVVGSHDVDTGDPVVVDLLAQRQLSKKQALELSDSTRKCMTTRSGATKTYTRSAALAPTRWHVHSSRNIPRGPIADE